MLRATEELTRQHYAEHVEKSFFDGLLKQFVGKLVVVAVFEGPEGMIQNIRSLVGDTDPKKAKRETIREMFGTGVPDNAIHASASPDEAEREIAIWFSPKEIFPSKFGTDHDPTWV